MLVKILIAGAVVLVTLVLFRHFSERNKRAIAQIKSDNHRSKKN